TESSQLLGHLIVQAAWSHAPSLSEQVTSLPMHRSNADSPTNNRRGESHSGGSSCASDLVVLKSTRPQPIFRGPACRRRTCWAICDFSMLAAVDLDLFICARCLQRTADQSGYGARAGSAMASWCGSSKSPHIKRFSGCTRKCIAKSHGTG